MNRKGNVTATRPIKDMDLVRAIAAYLKKTDQERGQAAYIVWLLCVNGGIRVSDVLRLRVAAICGNGKRVRDCFQLREQKTGKFRTIVLNKATRSEIQCYVDSIDWRRTKYESFLFPSLRKKQKHASYEWMNNRIKEAAAACGICATTHSMRKTFAYLWYKTNLPHYGSALQTARELQENILHHKKLSDTLRYIDEEETFVRETCREIDITI